MVDPAQIAVILENICSLETAANQLVEVRQNLVKNDEGILAC